jgi:hypothetical protein
MTAVRETANYIFGANFYTHVLRAQLDKNINYRMIYSCKNNFIFD